MKDDFDNFEVVGVCATFMRMVDLSSAMGQWVS